MKWSHQDKSAENSSEKRTCVDSHAVCFLLANSQHLLVDVTDHNPGFHWPVHLLSRVFRIIVRPGWSLRGASRPPPLLLLLKTNVLQETEGDITCGGGWPPSERLRVLIQLHVKSILPVPPAMSKSCAPGWGFMTRRSVSFHKRWIPRLMASFMTSYFCATFSNTLYT